MSPPRRLRASRAATREPSPVTVSNPRRVQDTSDKPASRKYRRPAADSGCRRARERAPAGRRLSVRSRPEPARISSRSPRGPRNAKPVRVRVGVVLHAVTCGTDGRRRSSGCASARRPTQKNVALFPDCSSKSRTVGVTSGSGPSSKVRATTPSAAGASGNRVMLGPSQEHRGNMPGHAENRVVADHRGQHQLPGAWDREHRGERHAVKASAGDK